MASFVYNDLVMETLAKLFGGEIKVKLLRLFVFNENLALETNLIAERIKAPVSKVRRELTNLEKLGLIRAKNIKGKKKRNKPLFQKRNPKRDHS